MGVSVMPYINGIWKSQEMYAVFDKRRISEEVIASTNSPYSIWNNPALWNNSRNPPAYVLANPYTHQEKMEFRKTLDSLLKDPNVTVKEVFCGN